MIIGSRAGRAKSGVNLVSPWYYATEHAFLDRFKVSSNSWISTINFGWNNGPAITVDANGYPNNIDLTLNAHNASVVVGLSSQFPSGTSFEITWTGDSAGVTADGGTAVGNKITFSRSTSAYANQLIRIWRNGISNLQLRRVGDPTTGTFTPEWVTRNKRYSVLRFMGWTKTNDARAAYPVLWSSRSLTTHRTYDTANGVPWETCIQACNETGSGGWFCVPHGADDNYVTSLATLIRDTRVGNWPVYIEHSNEVWNNIFPQFAFCDAQAGDYLDYHILRTKQIGTLMRATGLDINLVLGLWSANAYQAEQKLRDGVTLAGHQGIDCFAIAPYFGNQISEAQKTQILSGGVTTCAQICSDHIVGNVRDWIIRHKQLADDCGKRLVGYEGGQHLQVFANAPLTAIYTDTNRNTVMHDLYQTYLEQWDQLTNGALMCLFEDVYPCQESGNWGLQEYAGESTTTAHKLRSWLTFLAANKQ
jgi:hypothetical protein